MSIRGRLARWLAPEEPTPPQQAEEAAARMAQAADDYWRAVTACDPTEFTLHQQCHNNAASTLGTLGYVYRAACGEDWHLRVFSLITDLPLENPYRHTAVDMPEDQG